MRENQPFVSPTASVEEGRKAWSEPVVSFLSIDETANGSTTGSDGGGSFTGS